MREDNRSFQIEEDLLKGIVTNKGENLYDLSFHNPVMLFFLRHFGCIFCKESLYDLSKRKALFDKQGVQLVLVHMANNPEATEYLAQFGLEESAHISDIECKHYAEFGLVKGSFSQLYGLKVLMRGIEVMSSNMPKSGLKKIGDGLQMPGIFLIYKGKIKDSFIHKLISDRPDYDAFIEEANLL